MEKIFKKSIYFFESVILKFVNSNFLPFKKYDIMVYKELLFSYIVSFLVISLVVWLKEIYFIYIQYIQKGAYIWTTLKIFFFSLPFSMAITIPASMVMATLLTFNKFSLNLEILVLRSSGFKKTRLFLPVFVFSVFIAVLNYLFFDTVLVKGNEMYLRAMIEMRVEKPFIDVAPGEFPKIGNFSIGFDEVISDELKGIEIYEKGEFERIVKAQKGKIISSSGLPYYQVLLDNGTFVQKTEKGNLFSSQFRKAELRIDYEVSYIPTFDVRLQPRVMSRYRVQKIIEEMEKKPYVKEYLTKINDLNFKLFNSYLILFTTLPGYLFEVILSNGKGENTEKFKKIKNEISSLNVNIRTMKTNPDVLNYNIFVFEQHKKTSIPISSVVYALIGFVFGIMFKVRTGKGGSLIIGIVVVLIQTYLTFIAEIPIRNGLLDPVVGAWYSNVLLSIPAVYLILREKI